MKVDKMDNGFEYVEYETHHDNKVARLVQQSSLIGSNYADAIERPGSSFLWVGPDHHLDREEVAELVGLLNNWLKTGNLSKPKRTKKAKS